MLYAHTSEFAVLVECEQYIFVCVNRRWREESSILIHSCEMEKTYLSGRS